MVQKTKLAPVVRACLRPALLLFALCVWCGAQRLIPAPIHGVTADDTHDVRDKAFLSKLLASLNHLSVQPTTRIVYTPGDGSGYYPASSYLDATTQIQGTGYVMAEPVDSYYMKCFTREQHLNRFKDYVTTMGNAVDLWEIGNEINGEWLFGKTSGCAPKATVSSTSQADVVAKMTQTYDYVKAQGKIAALTFYYNTPCSPPPASEMFSWARRNVPARMKNGLDYVLVSYYELDCHGYKPDWQSVFGRLAAMFPNSKLGISEFGYSGTRPPKSALEDLIDRYYAIHPNVPNWAGGGFYWEFAIDMVPYDPPAGSYWSTLNTALSNQK
jgi:hypothetical protein